MKHTLEIEVAATIKLGHVMEFLDTAPESIKDQVREVLGTNTEAALQKIWALDPEKHEPELNRLVEIMDSKGYALVTDDDEDDAPEYLVDFHPDRCLPFRIPSSGHAGDLADAAQLQQLLGSLGVADALALLRKEVHCG